MPFTNGQNVGPYRILEQLGQGGMATVYKAYHAGLDRYVAIKVLHPAFREDPSFAARFTREARVVAKLEHPNIVPIYDYSEYEGQPYLVMKFIEGETLKARLTRGPLSAQEAIRVIEAVGAALSYAHSKGILHRDIKPSNVLLTPDGGIYLADFGLARIAQSGESTLSTDMMLGTPHYISPEQAQGRKNLDQGTDIYSFGVVMYELSVGRVPFNADTPFSIIHDHIFTPLPLPRQINPKVPTGVERVLLKALAKDPKDRYTEVDTLVKAFLESVREVTEVAKAPGSSGKSKEPSSPPDGKAEPGPGEKKPPIWKRIPKWLLVILGIMACACMCFVGVSILGNRAERMNQQATETAQAALSLVTPMRPSPTKEKRNTEDKPIPEDLQEVWDHLEQGIAFFEQGNWENGEREFRIALEMMPAERTGVILMAVERLNEHGHWFMSALFLQKGLDYNPNDPALRAASAEVLFHVAEDREAEELLKWFVETIPRWAIPHATFGRWMMTHSAVPEDGEGHIQQSIELASNEEEKAVVHTIKGEYLCATGNTAEGIAMLKHVLNDSPIPPWLREEVERMIARWQPN